MDFNRQWTAFALDAEVEHFGTSRIAAAHNALRAEVERLRADAERYRWLRDNARRIDFAGLCWTQGCELDARVDAALAYGIGTDPVAVAKVLSDFARAVEAEATADLHAENKRLRQALHSIPDTILSPQFYGDTEWGQQIIAALPDEPQDVDCNCPGFCTGKHND